MHGVVSQSSFEFMKAHAQQFDEHSTFEHLKHRMNIEGEATDWVGKVREGGRSKLELSAEVEERLSEMWSSVFHKHTGIKNKKQKNCCCSVCVCAPNLTHGSLMAGIASYEELRARIRAMNEACVSS